MSPELQFAGTIFAFIVLFGTLLVYLYTERGSAFKYNGSYLWQNPRGYDERDEKNGWRTTSTRESVQDMDVVCGNEDSEEGTDEDLVRHTEDDLLESARKIPLNTPHRDIIMDSGILTMVELERVVEQDNLESIHKIGPKRAEAINEYMEDLQTDQKVDDSPNALGEVA